MPRVFISHSSQDRDFVESDLIPFLRKQGVDPWYSRDDIEAASHWEATILRGLRACSWFMVVLTPQSVASEWVQTEVSWALAERKGRVIPLLVQPCDADELHLALRRIQWIDLVADPATGWRNLASLVGKLSDGGSSPETEGEAVAMEPPRARREPPVPDPSSTEAGESAGEGYRSLLGALLSTAYDSEHFRDLASPQSPVFSGLRFLVVDDEPFIRMVMTEILTRYGAEVETAEDGLEGLELARNGRFDLLILDLMMPLVGGEEVVETLREEGIPTLIVIFSGFLSGHRRLRALSPPIAYFVSKPPDLKEFLSIVSEVLSAEGLRAVLFQMGKFTADGFSSLRACRSILSRLRAKCAEANDLFQSSLRHKADDCFREAARQICGGRDLGQSAENLRQTLGNLECFWDRYQSGRELGLRGIVEGRMEEIPLESPMVSVSSVIDPALDEIKVPAEIETLFVMAFLEFLGNALDALSGQGEIRVSLSRLKTRKCLLLSVWNDGEPIPPILAGTVFAEGTTTKGAGRGMGLFIIDQLARRLGGTVKLTQGKGVQFTLEVPEAAFSQRAQ